jgi:hypothetical protein
MAAGAIPHPGSHISVIFFVTEMQQSLVGIALVV